MAADADQGDIIEFLSRGGAYGRPGDKVTRIDTHASVVFLVGDRAYKLKRAIRFSYLDYSTVAKREAMCRAEYQLNRRTAPQLYRGVRAVTRNADGALALDAPGEAADWLVEMAQFPQEALFDRLAERHELTPDLMRDLADEIAAFHRAAEPCNGAAIAAVARESLDNLRRTGAALDQATVAELARRTEAALGRLAPVLAARPARRCHGDLHLRNICLIDGKPVLFDGIEFNDSFTCIDPL
ncbi:MAG TPA: phosphotransferase, partial [Stellaceae bacterium]